MLNVVTFGMQRRSIQLDRQSTRAFLMHRSLMDLLTLTSIDWQVLIIQKDAPIRHSTSLCLHIIARLFQHGTESG